MAVPTVLILQLDPADPPGRLTAWLADAGADVQVVDVAAGEPVPDPVGTDNTAGTDGAHGADGLVVLGGGFGCGDDAVAPFLPAVRAALRSAVTAEVPTLGICLGGQLLAASHGGRVIVNPNGPELGAQLIAKRANAATDPLFAAMPIAPDVIQWHYDTVSELPPGAVHLASSPVSENQAFRLGRVAWGLQCHIETTPEIVRAWAASDAATLQDYDLERIVERAAAVHDDIEQAWQPFVAEFARICADPSIVPATARPPAAVATAEPITDAAAIRAALAAELGASRGPASLPTPGLRPDVPSTGTPPG